MQLSRQDPFDRVRIDSGLCQQVGEQRQQAHRRMDSYTYRQYTSILAPMDHKNIEPDTLKGDLKKGASVSHSAGGKIPYPKHIWSPAGGWYSQPANWKANTAVMASVILGITAVAWSISADREHRTRFPEPHRFYPSRWWSREVIEHERNAKR